MTKNMNIDDVIEKTIRRACVSYRDALELYEPRAGAHLDEENDEDYRDNGFPERNLTFHFAKSFCELFSGCAYMELPFKPNNGGNYNHIDSYVVNSCFGILIESKRLYGDGQLSAIEEDAVRLSDGGLIETIKKTYEKKCEENKNHNPKPHYALILAEAWGEEYAEWWKSKNHKEFKKKTGEWINLKTLRKFENWTARFDEKDYPLNKFSGTWGAIPFWNYLYKNNGQEEQDKVYCLYTYRELEEI